MIASSVFILCSLTSFACFLLLLRAYFRTKTKFLFWSALCFLGFAANNALLYVDIKVLPTVDLSTARSLPALAGICCLLYGLFRDIA